MKFTFVDIENCTRLLPRLDRLHSILRQFDGFLETVDQSGDERRLVTKLASQNASTLGQATWMRLYKYDADLGVTIDLASNVAQFEVKPYYKYPQFARPRAEQRVVAQFWQRFADGTQWGYKLPLQCLLKNWGDANAGHQCYFHTIGVDGKELSYAGITSRNWLERLDEHLREMRNGNPRLFYKAWRDSLSGVTPTYGSELLDINATLDIAMKWEEWIVDKHTLSPKGLNMIPGGYKGLKFLYENRVTDRLNVGLEERERAIAEFVRLNPRKGLPNPFIAELWNDDDYYRKVIGSREKTLSPDQVLRIRSLAALGWSAKRIVDEVSALNVEQVRRVTKGTTYKRIQ